jgi:aminocarboxymuconate-semialdehyde decarboxylase
MRSLVEWGRTEATPPSPNIRDNTHMTFIYINHISLRERDPNTKTVEVWTERTTPIPTIKPPQTAIMPIVDIHTHVYPPKYMDLLRSRTTVPYVRTFPDAPDSARLIILPGEDDPSTPSTSRGRPIGQEYFDIAKKIAFMDLHHIDKSVISLANPWLDFLPSEEAGEAARSINDDVNEQCARYPGRLYFFGTLPLSANTDVVVKEIERLGALEYARGVILGTSGLGKGLDDAALDPVYAALEKHRQLIFLHPHYGLPASVYGPRASEYGHVLPLALGFPLETTIAVTRMLLSGVWDRFTKLNVLLAHSGGTLPFLAGRIESCILHDGHLKKHEKTEKRRDVWDILKTNIYLDAVIYSEVGLKAALDASGSDRLLFGMPHRSCHIECCIDFAQVPIIRSSRHWKKMQRSGIASMRTMERSRKRLQATIRRRRVYSAVTRCAY